MLPFLALHALAAQRGDGLHPKLLALFERHAGSETGLAAVIDPDETDPLDPFDYTQLMSGAAAARESRLRSMTYRVGL